MSLWYDKKIKYICYNLGHMNGYQMHYNMKYYLFLYIAAKSALHNNIYIIYIKCLIKYVYYKIH